MPLSTSKAMIYLDHAATTRPEVSVVEAMCTCMQNVYANPSAAYSQAGDARKILRKARESLSEMIGCDRNELFFTSGGTESNNWALQAARGKHVVLSAIEHSSVLEAARVCGCDITLVSPTSDGSVSTSDIEKAIRPDTALISVQLANNETGVLQPVAEIGELARKHRILFHCDAVQAFGHIPVDVRKLKVDLLSATSHKLYGPRGAGLLYIRSGKSIPVLIAGGGQENNRRSGTENVAAIHGFRLAAEMAYSDMQARAQSEKALLEEFFQTISAAIPQAKLLGANAERVPGIIAILLPGLASETAIAKLDMAGIQVSGGAACASAHGQPSHVYRSMGLTDNEAACVLRISPGRHTTAEELHTAGNALLSIWKETANRIP